MIRVFKPAQPCVVVPNEKAALEFFNSSCKHVKPWGSIKKLAGAKAGTGMRPDCSGGASIAVTSSRRGVTVSS